VHNKKALWGDE